MPSYCPTPMKDSFASLELAHVALHAQQRRGGRGSTPTHAYRCECGDWHLSGSTQKQSTRGKRRRPDNNHRNKKHAHRRKWTSSRRGHA